MAFLSRLTQNILFVGLLFNLLVYTIDGTCQLILAPNSTITAFEGSMIEFNCVFQCTADRRYSGSWTQGNIAINKPGVEENTSTENRNSHLIINTTLVISAVKQDDEGEYRCLLTDHILDVIVKSSNPTKLIVNNTPIPEISISNVEAGIILALCTAEKTEPKATLYWFDQSALFYDGNNETHIIIKGFFKTDTELVCIMLHNDKMAAKVFIPQLVETTQSSSENGYATLSTKATLGEKGCATSSTMATLGENGCATSSTMSTPSTENNCENINDSQVTVILILNLVIFIINVFFCTFFFWLHRVHKNEHRMTGRRNSDIDI